MLTWVIIIRELTPEQSTTYHLQSKKIFRDTAAFDRVTYCFLVMLHV